MKHQTKNWHSSQTIRAAAILVTGIAVCTWLGGNMSTTRHLSEKSAPSKLATLHLIDMPMIDMPNMHAKKLLAIPAVDDKFVIGLENRPNIDSKKNDKQGGVRAAIYQMPSLKPTGNKQIQAQVVVT